MVPLRQALQSVIKGAEKNSFGSFLVKYHWAGFISLLRLAERVGIVTDFTIERLKIAYILFEIAYEHLDLDIEGSISAFNTKLLTLV